MAADKEPLQARIPGSVTRRFKAYAALRGMEPNDLFVEVREHDQRTNTAGAGEPRERDAGQ